MSCFITCPKYIYVCIQSCSAIIVSSAINDDKLTDLKFKAFTYNHDHISDHVPNNLFLWQSLQRLKLLLMLTKIRSMFKVVLPQSSLCFSLSDNGPHTWWYAQDKKGEGTRVLQMIGSLWQYANILKWCL